MSHRLVGFVAALLLSAPVVARADALLIPGKPWIKPTAPSRVVAAPAPTGPRMELKPALWSRAAVPAPVLVAADTSQDRDAWRDLSTKPSHWVRPDTTDTCPGCALVASNHTCACHRG